MRIPPQIPHLQLLGLLTREHINLTPSTSRDLDPHYDDRAARSDPDVDPHGFGFWVSGLGGVRSVAFATSVACCPPSKWAKVRGTILGSTKKGNDNNILEPTWSPPLRGNFHSETLNSKTPNLKLLTPKLLNPFWGEKLHNVLSRYLLLLRQTTLLSSLCLYTINYCKPTPKPYTPKP